MTKKITELNSGYCLNVNIINNLCYTIGDRELLSP